MQVVSLSMVVEINLSDNAKTNLFGTVANTSGSSAEYADFDGMAIDPAEFNGKLWAGYLGSLLQYIQSLSPIERLRECRLRIAKAWFHGPKGNRHKGVTKAKAVREARALGDTELQDVVFRECSRRSKQGHETKSKAGPDGKNTYQKAAEQRVETMGKVGTSGLTGFQEAAANRPETYGVDYVVPGGVAALGKAVYGRLAQQRQARKAASAGMNVPQLAAWTRQEKKEQQKELEDLDYEGAKELIVHVAFSTLKPCKAFQELYPQLGWSKFEANTTVKELVGHAKLVQQKFRSYPRVTQLLSEARAQSKGK
jgi:hypothetical protein